MFELTISGLHTGSANPSADGSTSSALPNLGSARARVDVVVYNASLNAHVSLAEYQDGMYTTVSHLV